MHLSRLSAGSQWGILISEHPIGEGGALNAPFTHNIFKQPIPKNALPYKTFVADATMKIIWKISPTPSQLWVWKLPKGG